MTLFALCLLAYLLGSLPFGVVVGKWRGMNLREQGSGNIGAANVFRNLGWRCGLLVLVLDAVKSMVALRVAEKVLGPAAVPLDFVAVGAAAILGHNFSCFLKFTGGKGVASTLGVFLFLSWQATAAAFSFWILAVILTGYASLGSLSSALLLPVFMQAVGAPEAYVGFSAIAFLLILFAHRRNIVRLMRGEENKLVPCRFGKKERI